jgi:hypothetical protein
MSRPQGEGGGLMFFSDLLWVLAGFWSLLLVLAFTLVLLHMMS